MFAPCALFTRSLFCLHCAGIGWIKKTTFEGENLAYMLVHFHIVAVLSSRWATYACMGCCIFCVVLRKAYILRALLELIAMLSLCDSVSFSSVFVASWDGNVSGFCRNYCATSLPSKCLARALSLGQLVFGMNRVIWPASIDGLTNDEWRFVSTVFLCAVILPLVRALPRLSHLVVVG